MAFIAINFNLIHAAEPIKSNCSWKSDDNKLIADLSKEVAPSSCTASRPDDCDELRVKEKGRTYFYSLPHQSCKSDIFIVYGDQVTAVDYFPDRTGVFTDYVRVVYSSKILKKEISGWVEMKRLCRLITC